MSNTLTTSEVLVTVEEYLAREPFCDVKHEYLAGILYAMAGASEAHNTIAANLVGMLYAGLRDRSCRVFGSDMKVKLLPAGDTYFYYPDAMISCDPTDAGHGWRERPAMLFEIISERTRRNDEREKRLAYRHLPSLRAYVRIEQSRPEVIVESREEEGWKVQRVTGLDAILRLQPPALELPLAELYGSLSFSTERD